MRMATVPTTKPTACVVHYEMCSDDDTGGAKFRDLWTHRELMDTVRKERNFLNGHYLSQSWDERLTTPHRYSSLRQPPHPPVAPTKDIFSWPNSRQLNTRQPTGTKFCPNTVPNLSGSTPLSHSLGAGPGDTSLTNNAEILDNPRWNFHLNAWVSSKLGHSNTYISLAGQTELFDRGICNYLPEFQEGPILPCPRYLQHMNKQTVLRPIPTTGKTKKILEKPKFWKWKGRTERPVAEKVEINNNKAKPFPLPSIPSASQESVLPVSPSILSSSNCSDNSSESSFIPVSSLTPSPASSPSHHHLPRSPESPHGSCFSLPLDSYTSKNDSRRESHTRSLKSPLNSPKIDLALKFKVGCSDVEGTSLLQGHVASFLTPNLTPQPSPWLSSPRSCYSSPSLLPSVGPLTPQNRMSPEMKRDVGQAAENEEALVDTLQMEEEVDQAEKANGDHPGEGEFGEEYSDYGSIRSGDIENQSSKSKAASVSLTSGIDEFSDSDSQLAPLFQSSYGDKPPIEFYQLTDPPKTASSMDWEVAGQLGDVESSEEDDIVLGVSPSHLKRLFFSNDYIEIMEVPTFGQAEFTSYDIYKGVTIIPGLEMTSDKGTMIEPPDKLILADMVTLHSPPPAPIPLPVMPSLPPPREKTPPREPTPPPVIPTPPPTKDPTPPPPPVSKPKRRPIVKKKKVQPVSKRGKTIKEEALPSMPLMDSTSDPVEEAPVVPLPDLKEEEEPAPVAEPPPVPSNRVAPIVIKKERPRPRPAPPRLTSPSPSLELECIQEEIEIENQSPDHLPAETPPPLRNDKQSADLVENPSNVDLVQGPTSPTKRQLPPPVLNVQSPEPEEDTTETQDDPDLNSDGDPLPPAVKDAAFAAELERERLAEERRQKAYDMFERLKSKRFLPKNLAMKTSFKEAAKYRIQGYQGWLAQFFIIKEDKSKMYQQIFNTVDEDDDGYLNCFETLMALKSVSGAQKLTENEEAYIVRVLELAEYPISQGTDFRLFSVLAALSQKIVSIDTWVRNLINSMDLTTLEWKMTKGKELFEWCVDEDSRCLQLERLLVELKAGGVSEHHQEEVSLTVGSKESWDLIDFLSYLPLFVMTHESVVRNPLDDSRDK